MSVATILFDFYVLFWVRREKNLTKLCHLFNNKDMNIKSMALSLVHSNTILSA